MSPETLEDAARTLMLLPRLTWREDPAYGLTLVAEGTDEEIHDAVWDWAAAFGREPVEVLPEPVHPGWHQMQPGWIAVELPVLGFGITVAGRLSGKGGAR